MKTLTLNPYPIGELVVVKASFKDGVTGVLADPTAITVRYGENPLAPVMWTYGSGAQIVRDSIGMYHANIDTTGLSAGTWYYLWDGTGNVQTLDWDAFVLEDTPV